MLLFLVVLLMLPASAQLDRAGDGFNVTLNTIPVWFVFSYVSPHTVTNYTFTPYADFTGNNSWMILGSNDGKTVNVIDEQMNVSLTSGTTYSFVLGTVAPYQYYYVYLFTGFGTAGEKLEVHMNAGTEEAAKAAVFVYRIIE
jgi:hypothetical protein